MFVCFLYVCQVIYSRIKRTVQFLILDLNNVFVYVNVSIYVLVLYVGMYDVGFGICIYM